MIDPDQVARVAQDTVWSTASVPRLPAANRLPAGSSIASVGACAGPRPPLRSACATLICETWERRLVICTLSTTAFRVERQRPLHIT